MGETRSHRKPQTYNNLVDLKFILKSTKLVRDIDNFKYIVEVSFFNLVQANVKALPIV